MSHPKLKAGDVVLMGSDSLFGRLIKWFTRGAGEPQTLYNHAAIIVHGAIAVESLATVTARPFSNAIRGFKRVAVWRLATLPPDDARAIAVAAVSYLGEPYNPLRIIPHALDGLLGKVFGNSPRLFRRIIPLIGLKFKVCSGLVAAAYRKAGFVLHSREPSPDDLADFFEQAPGWERVWEANAETEAA